jgi:hypothetical protein
MFTLPEARAIQISRLFRRTCEDDIRHLYGDAPIREVPNHSEIDNAQIVRIPRRRLCGPGGLVFCTTWQDAHCHLVSSVAIPGLIYRNREIPTRTLTDILQILNAIIQKRKSHQHSGLNSNSLSGLNAIHSDEIRNSSFFLPSECSALRLSLDYREPVLASLLSWLFLPIAQRLTGDSSIAQHLRDRPTWNFRLGQAAEDVVDFFMSINAMRAFGHPLKGGNNHESELDPQK